MSTKFSFKPPKETVVYTPSKEEFEDALKYIQTIMHEAKHYGICKIRPPKDWNPPFAGDIDKIRFKPRVQRINELDACTRENHNYLRQVSKYWELQGSALKIPFVLGKPLDLFKLKNCVRQEGGFETVDWKNVATKMGYGLYKQIASTILESHYQSIIYPFDVFEEDEKRKENTKHERKEMERIDNNNTSTYSNLLGKDGLGNNPKRLKEDTKDNCISDKICEIDYESGIETDDNRSSRSSSVSKELAKLQFYGAGPKTTLPMDKEEKTRGLKLNFGKHDPLEAYACVICQKNDAEDQLLLCNECDGCCHTFCLVPPLTEIPQWDWSCKECVAKQVAKPVNPLSFEYSDKEYTLQSFGNMANNFKSKYFETEGCQISTSGVEKEYWRILNDFSEDVTVVYGADEHTVNHGSGFSKTASKNLNEDQLYATSNWNLNNLPVLPDSILRYIDTDINGMTVPWLYIGMCFSSFCWHVEDHWSLSINYLHMGEPKTWYGVPEQYANDFERVIKKSAPELFKADPNLLHSIVTTLNPNILEENEVPVYRTDQRAGEFVITWPRAYHAGFNQGFNVAEAVNFAPPCWLDIGRQCIENYALNGRTCVFSHDELVCNMASNADSLTIPVARATCNDLKQMIGSEYKLRKVVFDIGVSDMEREAFETLSDDDRECAICKTTCYLSAFVVSRNTSEPFCLRHIRMFKAAPQKLTLYYRYTLDELVLLLKDVEKSIELHTQWEEKVKIIVKYEGQDKFDEYYLKTMLQEFQSKGYPQSDLSKALHTIINEADRY